MEREEEKFSLEFDQGMRSVFERLGKGKKWGVGRPAVRVEPSRYVHPRGEGGVPG